MNDKKRLVIIDALNLFIRNYVVNPTLDTKGNPFGDLMNLLSVGTVSEDPKERKQ